MVIMAISVGLVGCKFSHYVRKDTHVTALERFPKDSVTLVEPVFSTWFAHHYPSRGLYRLITGDEEEYTGNKIDIADRADSIRSMVVEAYRKTPITDTAFFRIKSGCMVTFDFKDSSYITYYTVALLDSTTGFSVLNPHMYRCLALDTNRYNIIHVFTMSTWMTGLGDETLQGKMLPHVVVLYKNRVVYYRHYYDNVTGNKKHFPKGHPDREEWPYFPSFQMRRVVEALTKDLAARIQ